MALAYVFRAAQVGAIYVGAVAGKAAVWMFGNDKLRYALTQVL
jgi:hypothetical protein